MTKKKLTLKSLQVEIDSLNKYTKSLLERIDIIDSQLEQGKDLIPCNSWELESEPKKEDYIWWTNNFIINKITNELYKVLYIYNVLYNITRTVLMDIKTRRTIVITFAEKPYYTQAPDTMIFDYLMKGYREQGWKEGSSLKLKESDNIWTVKKFILNKQDKEFSIVAICTYPSKFHDKSQGWFPIDECTLLTEKLMFDGEEVYFDKQKSNLLTFEIDNGKSSISLTMDLIDFILPYLIPERQKELQAIINKLDKT